MTEPLQCSCELLFLISFQCLLARYLLTQNHNESLKQVMGREISSLGSHQELVEKVR